MRAQPADLRAIGHGLSVGILAGDWLRFADGLDAVESAGVGMVHVDIMDGTFCPGTTVGPAMVNALPAPFIRDVHLMVEDPVEKAGAYVDAGADILTFHVEATKHPHRVLQSLAGTGVVRGVALNPGSPLELLDPLLDDLELVLLLAVNPGWGGQAFIPTTDGRLRQLRARLERRGDVALAVDGGITEGNVAHVAALGADVIVAGSAVFKDGTPKDNAEAMMASIAQARGAGRASS